jgi:DNA-binding MarR family transcriptional regulator
LTKRPEPWKLPGVRDAEILEILRAYPQIYHACHLEHPRARSSAARISARDAWILGHLDAVRPLGPGALARHMGLGAPTVSEALRRLERLGYVERRAAPADRRRIELRLTRAGVQALKTTSVLDARRVARLLHLLTPLERQAALAGLALLARAARELNAKEPKRWDDTGAS